MALHRYADLRVEVFYFDSPCTSQIGDYQGRCHGYGHYGHGRSTFWTAMANNILVDFTAH